MATLPALQSIPFYADAPNGVILGTAQTGNADSTNTAFRGHRGSGGAVVITSTVGGTITTAVTTAYLLQELVFWQYLKLVYSANTNVTLSATAYL